MVAMLFVIFDVEAVFIITWAIAFQELGWPGYISICIFVFILLVVLIYEWRNGALNFGPNGKKILKASKNLTKDRKSTRLLQSLMRNSTHFFCLKKTNKIQHINNIQYLYV